MYYMFHVQGRKRMKILIALYMVSVEAWSTIVVRFGTVAVRSGTVAVLLSYSTFADSLQCLSDHSIDTHLIFNR